MRGLIFSDTHKHTARMKKIIAQHRHEIDMIIHLGDCLGDCDKIKELYPHLPVEGVGGNNDPFSALAERVIEAKGQKILLTHGHIYRVKDGAGLLLEAAKKAGCDAVFFGHTHLPFIERCGQILIVNPGSLTLPVYGTPTYAMMEVGSGQISAKIVEY